VHVPPHNTKEERDAEGDERDILAGRAILEPAAEERESDSRDERQQIAPTVFRQIALTYEFGAIEVDAAGSPQGDRRRRQALLIRPLTQ
jgi:hypothetical protein